MAAPGIFAAIVFGLVLGSFATALIHRVPRGLPWSHGSKSAYRSACPKCSANLKPVDLIPVLSWLSLRGRCRSCGSSIGLKYLLTELGVVLACLGVYAVFGFSLVGIVIMATVPFMTALLVIDLEHKILPNQLVGIVAALGFIHLLILLMGRADTVPTLIEYIGGAVLYAGLVWLMGVIVSRVLKRDSLGFGDVKFFFAAGLWLGLSNLAWFCMLSGGLGIVLGLSWQTLKKERIFPFGPALIAALYVLLLLDGSLLL